MELLWSSLDVRTLTQGKPLGKLSLKVTANFLKVSRFFRNIWELLDSYLKSKLYTQECKETTSHLDEGENHGKSIRNFPIWVKIWSTIRLKWCESHHDVYGLIGKNGLGKPPSSRSSPSWFKKLTEASLSCFYKSLPVDPNHQQGRLIKEISKAELKSKESGITSSSRLAS